MLSKKKCRRLQEVDVGRVIVEKVGGWSNVKGGCDNGNNNTSDEVARLAHQKRGLGRSTSFSFCFLWEFSTLDFYYYGIGRRHSIS